MDFGLLVSYTELNLKGRRGKIIFIFNRKN